MSQTHKNYLLYKGKLNHFFYIFVILWCVYFILYFSLFYPEFCFYEKNVLASLAHDVLIDEENVPKVQIEFFEIWSYWKVVHQIKKCGDLCMKFNNTLLEKC